MECIEYKMIAVGKMENGFVSRYTISHKAAVASLSLSALVSDPAASRPPAESEDVHRLSVRRC